MTGRPGTILSLDPHDALGWIQLDDGERVRFGGTALEGFATEDLIGIRVVVLGTIAGYQGVPKAVRVTPLVPVPPTAAKVYPATPRRHWPTFVREHPRWSDAAAASVPFVHSLPPLALPRHPLFSAWHDEICATAPVSRALGVPTVRAEERFVPTAEDCFAHGRLAFLDEARWPTCGLCARPLEMCVQLSSAVLADWIPGAGGLVALFCFHCGIKNPSDPRVGHVRFVRGSMRVEGPAEGTWKSASSGWLADTQRVTPFGPGRLAPSESWHGARAAKAPWTAASGLFGVGDVAFDELPPGATEDLLDDLGAKFDDWLESGPRQPASDRPGGLRAGAWLGGVPCWVQGDRTPSCGGHGEMQHLLDYDGGQFLDGALHVFVCPDRACNALAFVAEF